MSGITLKNIADTAIPTPATDKNTLFFDVASGEPSYKDDAGTVTSLVGIPGQGVPVGGTTGQVLAKINATDYNTQWIAPGMTNPMTTAQDVIVGGVSGAPARLGVGANGTFLGVTAGVVGWTSPSGSGDVVGPASAVDSTVALYDGTSGKLLKAGSKTVAQLMLQSIVVACSDETTNLATGTAKITFRMPYAFTLTDVRASLTAAQTAGAIFTVDINEAGTTILSTKLTIDNGEKTSTTAATPPVISDTSLADDAEITVDIDQVGTPLAKGLKVYLIGYPT